MGLTTRKITESRKELRSRNEIEMKIEMSRKGTRSFDQLGRRSVDQRGSSSNNDKRIKGPTTTVRQNVLRLTSTHISCSNF